MIKMSPLISWNEWATKYKPVDSKHNEVDNYWDAFFETTDEVADIAQTPYNIWTVVDNNPNSVYLDIVPGYRVFNRMGFFVTKINWEDKDMTVSNDPSYKE